MAIGNGIWPAVPVVARSRADEGDGWEPWMQTPQHIRDQIKEGGLRELRHSLLVTGVPAEHYGYVIYRTARGETGLPVGHTVLEAGIVADSDSVNIHVDVPSTRVPNGNANRRATFNAEAKAAADALDAIIPSPALSTRLESIEHGLKEALSRIDEADKGATEADEHNDELFRDLQARVEHLEEQREVPEAERLVGMIDVHRANHNDLMRQFTQWRDKFHDRLNGQREEDKRLDALVVGLIANQHEQAQLLRKFAEQMDEHEDEWKEAGADMFDAVDKVKADIVTVREEALTAISEVIGVLTSDDTVQQIEANLMDIGGDIADALQRSAAEQKAHNETEITPRTRLTAEAIISPGKVWAAPIEGGPFRDGDTFTAESIAIPHPDEPEAAGENPLVVASEAIAVLRGRHVDEPMSLHGVIARHEGPIRVWPTKDPAIVTILFAASDEVSSNAADKITVPVSYLTGSVDAYTKPLPLAPPFPPHISSFAIFDDGKDDLYGAAEGVDQVDVINNPAKALADGIIAKLPEWYDPAVPPPSEADRLVPRR